MKKSTKCKSLPMNPKGFPARSGKTIKSFPEGLGHSMKPSKGGKKK